MYRFKVSKYKNAAPRVPKKEKWVTEIPCGQLMSSCGDFVTVSGKYVAFNIESGVGGCAGILPLNAEGRCNRKVPTVYAHSDFLTDMCFSPFDDDLLATCSHDGYIKLWDLAENVEETIDKPLLTVAPDEVHKKLDIIKFHPIADEVLSCAAFDAINVVDINVGETKFCIENGSESQFQSSCWKLDGSVIITSCKDTKNRVIDPRDDKVSLEFNGSIGNRDSRVVWMGNYDYILGTGFDKQRNRQIGIWDVRNPSSKIFSEDIDTASGCLMPFYDIDTNMVMLAGKGDLVISLFEFNESSKALSFSSSERLSQQTYGVGMTPKRVLDVMNGEVNRLYQLSKNTLLRLPYIIPRKSYREFHADLFPDTVYSGKPSMNAEEWFNGENKEVIKLSLDPKLGTLKPVVSGLKAKKQPDKETKTEPPINKTTDDAKSTKQSESVSKDTKTDEEKTASPPKTFKTTGLASKKSTFIKSFQSKYKHLLGELLHKDNNIENIRNLAESLPSESDGLQCYKDFLALPLSGPGGQIAVFQLSKPGRLPETDIPTLQNGCAVLDFAMDPFNNRRLAVACEDWHIRLWEIPEDGIEKTQTDPLQILQGHTHRVTIVKFHPTASNILVSASLDFTIRVWDLNESSEIGALEGHTDQILCLAWHPDGKYLATFSKDKKIRVFDPVEDLEPIKEGEGPNTTKGSRICWCGPKSNWLVLSTAHGSGRDIYLYDEDFKEVSKTDQLDNSPAVLALQHDETSNVIFATGKGDRSIYSFEVNNVPPYLHRLTPINLSAVHQGIALLRKDVVDVRKVEFARFVRLCKTAAEILSVSVPRIKTQFFQDDIFQNTRVTWKPSVTSEEWLDGKESQIEWISLQPAGMKKLSEAPEEAPKTAKYCSKEILSEKTDEEKKAELINAMMNKLDFDDKLEQDDFEGVDEDEWDD